MAAASLWADIREELLDRIFDHLPSFTDLACCYGVSKHWRFIALEREHAASQVLPWLLRPSTVGGSYFHLFSRTISNEPGVLQYADGARFLGSLPDGWFFVAHGQWHDYALLNLRTGEEVPLPEDLPGNQIPHMLQVAGIPANALLILAATRSPALTPDGDFIVAAITLGHHKAVAWSPGMDRWMPVRPRATWNAAMWERIMHEGFEDVIYYSCHEHEGFYFLTPQECLMVLDADFGDGEGVLEDVDLDFYGFPDHRMSSPPEAGQHVAGRYLVESGGRLLMVKRFTSPGEGTVSFQVFRLEWRNNDMPYWERLPVLMGQLLYIGRGCSRSFQTGRARPGFIYFLDDAEGFHDWSKNPFRCSDAGWCCHSTQDINKPWPEGPPPDCSPWIWRFH